MYGLTLVKFLKLNVLSLIQLNDLNVEGSERRCRCSWWKRPRIRLSLVFSDDTVLLVSSLETESNGDLMRRGWLRQENIAEDDAY